VVLRLRAQVLRLPLRPLRRHQPLPAHCKPPPHFASILFLLFLWCKLGRAEEGGAAVVLWVCFAVLNLYRCDDFLAFWLCSLLLQVDLPGCGMSG
jgi:hypothetical protein